METKDIVKENLRIISTKEINISVKVSRRTDNTILMSALSELGYRWRSGSLISVDNWDSLYTIICIYFDKKYITKGTYFYFSRYDFSDLCGIVKKKIRKPEEDPFDEENWGYIQESLKNINILKRVKKRTCVLIENSKDHNEFMRVLEDFGYLWGSDFRPTTDSFRFDYPIIVLYPNMKIYKSNVKHEEMEESIIYNFSDFFRNRKKIENPEVDPFGEENWGYIQESINPFFHNKKIVAIQIYTEEEYNRLMKILEDNDFIWASGDKPTKWPYKGEKVVILDIFGFRGYYNNRETYGVIFGQSLRSYNLRLYRGEEITYTADEFIFLLQGHNTPKKRQISKPDRDRVSEEKWCEMKNFKDFNKEDIINESKIRQDLIKYYFPYYNKEEMIEIATMLHSMGFPVYNYEQYSSVYLGKLSYNGFFWNIDKFMRCVNTELPIMNIEELRELYLTGIKNKIRKPDEDPFDEEDWGYVLEDSSFSSKSHPKWKRGDFVYYLSEFKILSKYGGKNKIIDVLESNDGSFWYGIENENGSKIRWIPEDELFASLEEIKIEKDKRYKKELSNKKREDRIRRKKKEEERKLRKSMKIWDPFEEETLNSNNKMDISSW